MHAGDPVAELSDAEFDKYLQRFVGQPVGPPQHAPDEVNVPMIRHWCEAAGDTNPVYLDPDAAAASIHGSIVAPPTMLQAWVMSAFGDDPAQTEGASRELVDALYARGFIGVIATNCEQTYERYLRPGDRLRMRSTIESVSEQKQTALGAGHFITTRLEYEDANGELVATMMFRLIRYRPSLRSPATQAEAERSSAGASSLAPVNGLDPARRPQPAITPDNEWWFSALDDGKLQIQRCVDCGRLRHPPGPMCPSCRSLKWDAVDAPLEGTVHSFVVTHHPQVAGFDYPLPIVLVDLGDGIRMVMNTVDTDIDDVAVGRHLQVSVRPADGSQSLPFATILPEAS